MDQETAPESFNEAARDDHWVQSDQSAEEQRGLAYRSNTAKSASHKIEVCLYRVKKDWTGKVIKRKSRLVVQGFSQQDGVDYDETFAPVAKVTTFQTDVGFV